jgi:hypothetical protein
MWFVLVVGGAVASATPADVVAVIDAHRAGREAVSPPRIPSSAYERALGGALVASVDTGSGAVGAAWGVVAMNEPIERVWMAVNDEVGLERHLPTQTAAVLVGSDHGAPRTLYEYLPLPVVQDRWWVVEVEHSEGLFHDSDGRLWEQSWRDLRGFDVAGTRVATEAAGGARVARTEGAWLLVAVEPNLTLVEYYVRTDPGGAIPAVVTRFADGAVRDTLRAVQTRVVELRGRPTSGFVRPDGAPL